MQLVIAEKPSAGTAIASVIGATKRADGYMEGNGYIVTWCYGHLVGPANPEEYDDKYKEWSFEQLPIIPSNWLFVVSKNVVKQFRLIKSLICDKRVDTIINATDADREGECIFRYVYNKIGIHKPCKRLWISSMESEAIKQGFSNLKLSTVYDNLYKAGLCRAKSDWLVGMNFTRLFSCRYNSFLSIGRVQTPTLAMIVKRDYDIANFVKQKYFTVDIVCENGLKAASERIEDETVAINLQKRCENAFATVINKKKENKTVNPPKLFDLTSLQREANKKFGYTAQQTLDSVQKLYEQKLCTYPRTDSQFIPDDMAAGAVGVINIIIAKSIFGEITYSPDINKAVNNKKATDHPALIPQKRIADINLDDLETKDRNILLLMSARLIIATASQHKYESTQIQLSAGDSNFTASGKAVIAPGFKEIEKQILSVIKDSSSDNEKENAENILPIVEQGQRLEITEAESKEHWTSPPKPFTEDTLLSAMETAGNNEYDENSDIEKKGLGTPATRASIIETLVKREYIERKKKQLLPSEKGKALIDVVPVEVKSPKLTANWEMQLHDIEKGRYNDQDFMKSIENFVNDICSKFNTKSENAALKENNYSEPLGKCPNCGEEIKKGKFGFYCSGKCGMNVGKVYGKELTKSQLRKLLAGKEITFISKGKKTTAFPEVVEFSYTAKNGKTLSGFQWKT